MQATSKGSDQTAGIPHCWKSHVTAHLCLSLKQIGQLLAFVISNADMGLAARKPVLGVSHEVKFKPACSATETS